MQTKHDLLVNTLKRQNFELFQKLSDTETQLGYLSDDKAILQKRLKFNMEVDEFLASKLQLPRA